MLTCTSCGNEYEGNFCPNCGTPAPQKVTCSGCGTQFEGNFCPTCGKEVELPLDEICRNLYDAWDNLIDVDLLAGVYLSVKELRGYFQRNTHYTAEEIEILSEYIYHNIDGEDLGIEKSASAKSMFEAPSKAIKAQSRGEMLDRMRENREKAAAREAKAKAWREEKRTARCPKCGSTSLSADRQGFGFGKAIIGQSLFGRAGGLAGSLGSNKVRVVCLKCGHKWKL